jgi:hypothetical protein
MEENTDNKLVVTKDIKDALDKIIWDKISLSKNSLVKSENVVVKKNITNNYDNTTSNTVNKTSNNIVKSTEKVRLDNFKDITRNFTGLNDSLDFLLEDISDFDKTMLTNIQSNKVFKSEFKDLTNLLGDINKLDENSMTADEYDELMGKHMVYLQSSVNSISDTLDKQLKIEIDNKRDEDLKKKNEKKNFLTKYKDKKVTAIKNKAESFGSSVLDAIPGAIALGLGFLTTEFFHNSVEKDKKFNSTLKGYEKNSKSVELLKEYETGMFGDREKAMEIQRAWVDKSEQLDKENKVKSELIKTIAKENNLSEDYVKNHQNEFDKLQSVNSQIDSLTKTMHIWQEKLSDIDSDLSGSWLLLSKKEKEIFKLDEKLKNKNLSETERSELTTKRQTLNGELFAGENIGKIAKEFGVTDVKQIIEMEKDLTSILEYQKKLKDKGILSDISSKELKRLKDKYLDNWGFDDIEMSEQDLSDALLIQQLANQYKTGNIDKKTLDKVKKRASKKPDMFEDNMIRDTFYEPSHEWDRSETDQKKYEEYYSKRLKALNLPKFEEPSLMQQYHLQSNSRGDLEAELTQNKIMNSVGIDTKASGGKITNAPTIVGENGAEVIQNGEVLSPLNTQHNDKLVNIFKEAMNKTQDNSKIETLLKDQLNILLAILKKNDNGVINNNINNQTTNVAVKPISTNRFSSL